MRIGTNVVAALPERVQDWIREGAKRHMGIHVYMILIAQCDMRRAFGESG